MFSSGVNLGGDGQFGLGGDMILAQAQTSTAKKTFSNSGTDPGFSFGLFATDPTTNLANGDAWYNSVAGSFRGRVAGITQIFPTITPGGFAITEVPVVTGSGLLGSSDFTSFASTKTFGRPTNVATTQLLTVNGTNANIGLQIQTKGTGALDFSAGSFSMTSLSAAGQLSFFAASSFTLSSAPDFNISTINNPSAVGAINIFTGNVTTSGAVSNLSLFTGTPTSGAEGTVRIQSRSTGLLSFWGVAGIARPTTAFASAAFVVNAGTAINTGSTFDGYTIAQLMHIVRNLGLLT